MASKASAPVWFRRLAVILPLWLALSALILLIYFDSERALLTQYLATLVVTALCALPALFAAYRLVPRLLYRRRIGAFVSSLLLLAFFNSVLTYIVAGGLYHLATGAEMFRSAVYVLYMMSIFFLVNSIAITIGCALKVIGDRFGIEAQLREVREEQVRTELAFLRAQINPHFLFNVLNTIYFQIHKSNDEARGSVEKLSELLRYQLYECTSDRLPIERELAYIRNYVGMQRLRLEPGTDVALDVSDDMSGLRIAPLLLLPLVENAFKHISHFPVAADNSLHISLRREAPNWFAAEVTNTYDPTQLAQQLLVTGGLGLQNVRRRLALLYPDAHQIEISKAERIFKISLKIRCDD